MVPRMTTGHDVALADFFAGLDSAVTGARRDHEAHLAAFFAGLGPVVATARRAQAVFDRRVAPRFSVFLGPRRADDDFKEREIDLSRAFGGLLDPTGTHGQGDAFLLLFLDEIRRSLDDDLRGGFPSSDTQECDVHLEYPTDEGRSIDIVLKMPGDSWIGIENKPWAGEQQNQIRDYMIDLQRKAADRTAWIVYMSGDGRNPTTAECLPSEQRERCLTMPYRTCGEKPPSVENWIRRCREQCEAERVRWFLKDFLEYVEEGFAPADRPGA